MACEGPQRRRPMRLQGYDYGQDGGYFVTVCTHQRQCLFGRLIPCGDAPFVELNEAGRVVQACWFEIPQHFPFVVLDAFLVMPDHVHGILMLQGHESSLGQGRGANDYSPLPCGTSGTLGSVVRGLKIGVTKWFRQHHPLVRDVWQRSYYEHVIRNDQDLQETRQYIVQNPIRTLRRSE